MRVVTAGILMVLASPASAQSENEIYTLYRNSVLDSAMRLHVATFDSRDGADYNAENCAVAADLFQRQEGVTTRFWCEPGRYEQ